MENHTRKVGYLGPAGTFTELAAGFLCPESEYEGLSLRKVEDVFDAVVSGDCETGVVPLENSTEGAVNATLDALLRVDVQITAMLMLPIRHCLLGYGEKTVLKILAHPQALAQCEGYVRQHFPKAETVPCSSNGDAAYRVQCEGSGHWAAIGPAAAAHAYRLQVLAEGIQDQPVNRTAFIQLRHHVNPSIEPHHRFSIAFSTENRPGALYHMLGIFERNGVNMTKILSRPMPESPGAYIFFVDIEGNALERILQALTQVENEASFYRYLGSYPVIERDSI